MGATITVPISKIGPAAIQKIPGVAATGDKLMFIQKFAWWRTCCLRLCNLFMFFMIAANLGETIEEVRSWRENLGAWPEAFQSHVQYIVIIQALISASKILSMCVSIFFVCKAMGTGSKDFNKSSHAVKQSWAIILATPFFLYTMLPQAAFFRWDLLRTDTCAMTLSSFLSLDPVTRAAFMSQAASSPDLAPVAMSRAPYPSDLEELRGWAGYTWCNTHYLNWENKLFSRKWVRASQSGGMPTAKQLNKATGSEGIIPSTLHLMATMTGVMMDPYFVSCVERKKVGVAGQLVEANSTEQEASPHDSHGRRRPALGDHHKSKAVTRPALIRRQARKQRRQHDHHGHFEPTESTASFIQQTETTLAELRMTTLALEQAVAARDYATAATEQAKQKKLQSQLQASQSTLERLSNDEIVHPALLESSVEEKPAHTKRNAKARALVVDAVGATNYSGALLAREDDSGEDLQEPDTKTDPTMALQQLNPAHQAVCAAFMASIGFLRSAAISRLLARSVIGLKTNIAVFKTLLPTMIGINKGCWLACVFAKRLVPSNPMPGHVLVFVQIVYMPPFMLFLAVFCQSAGSFAFAITCVSFAIMQMITMNDGFEYANCDTREEVEEIFKRSMRNSLYCKLGAVAGILGYCGYTVYIIMRGGVGAEMLKEFIEDLDFKEILTAAPLQLLIMFAGGQLMQTLAKLSLMEQLCRGMFDAIDDALSKNSKHASAKTLLKQWRLLCPDDRFKGGKSKKSHKDGGKGGGEEEEQDDFLMLAPPPPPPPPIEETKQEVDYVNTDFVPPPAPCMPGEEPQAAAAMPWDLPPPEEASAAEAGPKKGK